MADLRREKWNIDFEVGRSIRYHAYRRRFWNAVDGFSKVLTIISGTAVLVSMVGENHQLATVFAFAVAVTSALDVVLGFSSRARNHDGLYRAFSMLAQRISETGDPTADDITKWNTRRLEIEMDEPGIIDWLERRCSAEEAASRGAEVRQEWRLHPAQTFLSQVAFWPSGPNRPPPKSPS